MFRPRIIPTLLLHGKGLVKTMKFNKKKARYIGDPINAVRIFNDMESDELVFLDISATNENRSISVDLVKQIGDEAYMPFSVGGGISRIDQVHQLITAGAEKVIINSAFAKNPKLISDIANLFGSQSVIISIDVRKDYMGKQRAYISGGMKKIRYSLKEYIKRAEDYGAGEILVNSIDRDGTGLGYDIDLVKDLSSLISVPLIALGGANSIDQMKEVIENGGASAAAAGSRFVFHGPRKAVLINYPEREELISLFN